LRELPLLWGVNTFLFSSFDSIDQAMIILKYFKATGLVKEGDLVIHVASTPKLLKTEQIC
jgi:pyruvate kinase